MRSKSRAKRLIQSLNPLIGDFINTIGHKRTYGNVRRESALAPKADIARHHRHVRFVP